MRAVIRSGGAKAFAFYLLADDKRQSQNGWDDRRDPA